MIMISELSTIFQNCFYRVSRKTVYAFWFLISRQSEGAESNSWTFSYSPFNVDLKDVLDFVIWPLLEWVIAKLMQEDKNKNQHFDCMKNVSKCSALRWNYAP